MKECTRLIQKEITLIYIFLNAVLVLLVQLLSVFSNTREGDFQIARSYSLTSVIPRLYGRGYRYYLGLLLGVNKKVHIRKITLGIILCTLFNKIMLLGGDGKPA